MSIRRLQANIVKSLAAALLCLAPLASVSPALALSEIQREELPPVEGQQAEGQQGETPPADQAAPPEASPAAPEAAPPAETAEPDGDDPDAGAQVEDDRPIPDVLYDVSKLPEPVQRMRNLLLEAAKTGDPEKLRPLLGTGASATQLSLTDNNEDPIKFLMAQSGDEAGQEILAILEEVLEAGYVRLDAGTPEELYVWPYFYAYPLAKLTPQQKVEIYRIVTASDFDEMMAFGNYIFFRVGIAPDGRWAFFVAGE